MSVTNKQKQLYTYKLQKHIMDIYLYNQKSKKNKKIKVNKLKKPRKGQVLWVNIEKKEGFNRIKDLFNIHPITADDCLKRNSRIKIETFEEYAFIITYGIKIIKNDLKKQEVDFILGKNFLITNHIDNKVDVISTLQKDEAAIPSLMQRGPDFLMQYIMDRLIESYFPACAKVDEEIDSVEGKIFKKVDSISLQKLYEHKQETMRLRRHTANHREVLINLTTKNNPYISQKAEIYFRDTYDKIIQLNDRLETLKEEVANIAETHTTLVSNKMNEIMKVLTVIATIMLPLSVIGSIYGMNFRYMPELTWKYGYPSVLGFMALIAISMLIYFRRKKWI
ncbi:magnesium and cobalt transport protein CorA [Candidatus Woesearchaeota archaeon CG10_big_fil_rev_8_21_14_0_10_34_8]|nr:MAG: magnesium and cobalt transport protein CorA [Candidatus Woesearchaeota archaeon CG10_big_fil_rev_8_21_14_0_10_34_8]